MWAWQGVREVGGGGGEGWGGGRTAGGEGI